MKARESLLRWTTIWLLVNACQDLAQSTYTPYTFTTLAGTGSSGSVDGAGRVACFAGPQGVAVDNLGNVYVGDFVNNTIRKVTPAGEVTTLAGLAGHSGSTDGAGSAARFWGPSGLAVDGTGNVYVADGINQTIRKVTPTGAVTTLAGLAQVDQFGHAIGGSTDGTGSVARFYFPAGVAVDGAGNLFVADGANQTIRKVTQAGVVTTLAGLAGTWGTADGIGSAARFNWLRDVAVDGAGNIFVADAANNTIRKVTPAGVVTTIAGFTEFVSGGGTQGGSRDGTGSAARFWAPAGVAVDAANRIYVADYGNCTIRMVTPAGVVTTLAGAPGIAGSADGTGKAARFNHPYSVAVDSLGNVYVADRDNNKIRKGYLQPSIVISGAGFGSSDGQFHFTLAGLPGQIMVVEASSDLVNWSPIWTNTVADSQNFSDPQTGGYSQRFYRARAP